MLTETFQSLATATRNVFRNWKSTLLIGVVYALLLAVLYIFVIVKEATVAQVTLTFACGVVAPILFFMLQAMVAAETNSLPALSLLRKSLTSFWKLLLVTLPLIGLALLIAYLLARAQNHFGPSAENPATLLPRPFGRASNTPAATPPINWKVALFSTIRYLSLGLFLPLAAIQLWLATVREGLGGALKKLATLLARAFAPQSVLTYIVGFLAFAVVPYFLLFKTTQTSRAWLELLLLILRLLGVFALTLFGWTITVRALAYFTPSPPPEPANEAV